jgi:hypothetical protein
VISAFWGYPDADLLAVVIIGTLSALCLVCARLYLRSA